MSVVAAALIGLIAASAVAVVVVGEAMIDRSRATTVADTVALASVQGRSAGSAVADWYRDRGAHIEVVGSDASVSLGAARARSRAESGSVTVAPVLVAVVARAGQLLGYDLNPVELDGYVVVFDADDGPRFDRIAPDLGMCAEPSRTWAFTPC